MQTRYLSLALACAFALLLAIPSGAIPVQNSFTLTSVDWTSASIGGIGGGCGIGGTANLTVSGINGPVTHAYLYWHGIDNYGANCATPQDAVAGRAGAMDYAGGTRTNACDGIYDVATIQFNGSAVTGTSLGDATTNCWGGGSSRAYRAEVTSLVTGNGVYTLAAMVSGPCDDINGASLIVTFDDGNDLNNRDLVFFEGNDSNIASGFPGEDDGWHALLDGITYSAGTASSPTGSGSTRPAWTTTR